MWNKKISEPDQTLINIGSDNWIAMPDGGISMGSLILRSGTGSHVWFYTANGCSFHHSDCPETKAFFINALTKAVSPDSAGI